MANNTTDTLGIISSNGGVPAGWDWKAEYVAGVGDDGLERFSQGSATPDTTLLFAGPARFSGIAGETTKLTPIGLVESFSYSTQSQLQRLFEIGSNRSFFTRGKTISQIQIQSFLADQQNIMKALTAQTFNKGSAQYGKYEVNAAGTKAPGVNDFYMNLDSEALSLPFGILMLFKTKGATGNNAVDNGTVLGAAYLEYCMFRDFQFNVQSQSPVIAENVSIEFDRAVPVQLTAAK